MFDPTHRKLEARNRTMYQLPMSFIKMKKYYILIRSFLFNELSHSVYEYKLDNYHENINKTTKYNKQ